MDQWRTRTAWNEKLQAFTRTRKITGSRISPVDTPSMSVTIRRGKAAPGPKLQSDEPEKWARLLSARNATPLRSTRFKRRYKRGTQRPTFAAYVAIVPLIMLAEHAAELEPPVLSVTTSITIDAPVSTGRKNVIAFTPLAPPEDLLFRSGIAYPISAKIVGGGRLKVQIFGPASCYGDAKEAFAQRNRKM